MRKLLLVGGGGHCSVILDTLLSKKSFYDEIGIVDVRCNVGKCVCGIKIIGEDGDLVRFYREGYQYAFVTLGSIGQPGKRIELLDKLKDIGYKIPFIQDQISTVSQSVKIGEGVYIGKNAVLNSGVQIGKGAIINTGAIIEHDCVLGDFVHAAPGSIICGGTRIGTSTHVGAGAVVIQNIEIGKNVIIGAGAVIVKNVADNSKVVGNPGRVI